MRFHEILSEHFVNIRSEEGRRRYASVVLDLVNIAYAPVGGHVNITTTSDLDDFSFWKIVKRGGIPVAVTLYKDRNGRKLSAMGHDGSKEAKNDLKHIFVEDIKLKRMWAEVSGGFANYCIRLGLPPVSNDLAQDIVEKEILAKTGRFKYDRIIGGHVHTKMIVGFPNGEQFHTDSWAIEDVLFGD